MFRTTTLVSMLFTALIGFLIAPAASGKVAAATQLSVTIHPGQVRNTISRGIYSQFLEHIYHSADNGLWGEMIWNRSFEEPLHSTGSQWVRKGKEIRQLSLAPNIRKNIGATDWQNYRISLDAKKLGGAEGFMIFFYNHGDHWFDLNLGGWGNTRDVLQRGGANPRPQILVSKPTLHIHRGRWYHLRLRCEGPHIQVWVNGKSYFDRTVKNGIFSGGIGLGTWRTQAAYKNIVVTSVTDGKVLYNRVPAGEKKVIQHLSTRFWNRFGPGAATRATTDPRNSRICIKITSTNGETGVQQPNICLPSAGSYRGSLWVRDATAHQIVVSLLNGKMLLGKKNAIVDSAKWKRIRFSFSTASPVHHATLRIGFAGKGNVYLDQVSMMSDAARKLGGFRPDTLRAVEALKPAMIRWPGGGYSDSYHWMDGIGPQVDRVSEGEIWDDMDPNALGTDEFIHLCRLTGAKPEICINIGPPNSSANVREQYVREACHWLEYCNAPASNKWGALRAKYGHAAPYNVKYWEIGNEVWWGADGLKAARYAKILRLFVAAMKGIDPAIRIIACGGSGLDQKWNQQLLNYASGSFDYLSLHQYVPPQGFLTAAEQYTTFLRKTGQSIKASSNPHCKIFVSEWNAQSIDWRTGLFAGGILIGFERQGAVVRLSTPALFLRWVGAGAWNNAFINFNRCSWFPAPNYVVEQLWRNHFAKYRVAATSAKPLEADATLVADRKTAYYKAVNPTSRTIHLELNMGGGFPLASTSAQSVTAPSLFAQNTMRNPNRIAARSLAITVSGQKVDAVLAPYSATVVTMKRK